jgi:F-type H+-transporting ATPase subunit b
MKQEGAMKKRTMIFTALLLLPMLLLGNEGGEGGHYLAIAGREYDFFPRLFNFLIFAGLTYYLIAEPIKNFFASRTEDISAQLKEIEKKLQEAKEAREAAEQAVAESRKKAEEILKDTEKEIEVIVSQYKEAGEKEIANLEKQFEEKMELEERKMRRELIAKLLDENISTDDIPITGSRVVENISGKAA